MAAAAVIVILKAVKYQKEWAAYASRPLRRQIEELKEENISLKRKYAGLQGKYAQIKENFDLAAQEYEETAAGGNIEITPELIGNLSTMPADALLNPEFLESIGINPSLLKIPMVKSFISNFIESGGLQKIAAKLSEGGTASNTASTAAAAPVGINKEGRRYL